jgi:ABC-type branched-subunit amino acid transport system substrate-binding protein
VLAVMVLLTAGCGPRWSQGQRDELVSMKRAGANGSGGTGNSATKSAGSTSSTGSTGDTGGATGGGGGGGATGGSGQTGGGGATASGPSGPLPCAAPSDAPGVTADAVTVGVISSLTGPAPGVNAPATGAVRAYVAYRNSTGGVCGRKIVLREADDGSDNGIYRSVVQDMGPNILGLVGGTGTGDAGGADIVEAQKIPFIGEAVSPSMDHVSTVFNINPDLPDFHVVVAKYKWLYDQGVRKAALVYPGADQPRNLMENKYRPQIEAAGIQVVLDDQIPLTTLNYDSVASAVANSGADYVLLLHTSDASASLARAIADSGYKGLKFQDYPTAYASHFIDLAGPAANGTIVGIPYLPNEESGNAEQAAFLQWMEQIAPDQPKDVFAAPSWAAAKAFFDALEALPGPISREALLAQVATITSFDAGGFYGAIQLGPRPAGKGCQAVVGVVNGAWQRLAPAQGFFC